MIAVALELQHAIDHVFKDLWAGNISILGNMAYQKDRGCCFLGIPYQFGRALPYLRDRTRAAVEVVGLKELTKVKRVMQKLIPEAPQEVLLVLDGSTGQNAFEQAKQFTAATEVNALAVTKLDGTAKGGVVIGISDQFKIPVKYIGVGEGIEDLQVFNKFEFVDSFFG